MKKIPKAKSWEETLQLMQAQLHLLDDVEKAEASKKIVALEKAIALRNSLSSPESIAFNR